MKKTLLLTMTWLALALTPLPGWTHCGHCDADLGTDAPEKKEEAVSVKKEEARTLEERLSKAEAQLKDVGSPTEAGSPFPGKGGRASDKKVAATKS